jgi:5-formyltetrahydrofolate cyclo-ligase
MQAAHQITETARAKKRLREQCLQRRQSIPDATMFTASKSIARHYADHPILAFAESFAGYVSMRGEVDVFPLYELMARHNKTTALPRMDTRTKLLQFRGWKLGEALDVSAMGVREPKSDSPSIIPAVVLTPCVAFDADGFRLGYGGGWYDRTLTALRNTDHAPLFIGVAYASQEIDRLPIEPHDQPLDGILTEFGVSMFQNAHSRYA